MSCIGLVCDICNNEIDLSQFKGKKHKGFAYARTKGWSIGKYYLCPDHKNHFKNLSNKEKKVK